MVLAIHRKLNQGEDEGLTKEFASFEYRNVQLVINYIVFQPQKDYERSSYNNKC